MTRKVAPRRVSAWVAGVAATAVTVLLSAPGGRAAPPPGADDLEGPAQIEEMLDHWRFDEAKAALEALKRRVGGPSAVIDRVEGYGHFLDGDYDAAAASLDRALASAGDGDEARNFVEQTRVLRDYALGARDAVKGHKELRSAHFILRVPPADEAVMPYALEALEAAATSLGTHLGWKPRRPVRVDVYRSANDLAAVSSLTLENIQTTGTIALCKWNRLMITSPRALIHGYPWLDTLSHELVHYAVSDLSGDATPVWLQEGLAKFLEPRWRDAEAPTLTPTLEHELAKGLRAGKLIGFEAMHPSMAKLPSGEAAALAFAEVAVAVEYLHATGGKGALPRALAGIRSGADAKDAVAHAAGAADWAAFEKGWRAHMAGKKYRIFAGFDSRVSKPRLRKAAAAASKRGPTEDEALLAEVGSETAARHLRLGNMFLSRGRPRSAAIQYGKAAAKDGSRWTVAVKLGRAHLALGEPDRALAAVASARELYPELPGPALVAGRAHMARGELRDARLALEASMGANPFDPETHCALAHVYEALPASDAPPPARIERERRLCRDLAE